MSSRLSTAPYYRANSPQSISLRISRHLAALFLLLAAAQPAAADIILERALRAGSFTVALDRISQLEERLSESRTESEVGIRQTALVSFIEALHVIDRSSGPLRSHEREFLLRRGLETLLADLESYPAARAAPERLRLLPILEKLDSYEDAQLRRALLDIGRLTQTDGAPWRSAMQRRGEQIVSLLEAEEGMLSRDVRDETEALLRAIGAYGERALANLVERIRSNSRQRGVVQAARNASTQLR